MFLLSRKDENINEEGLNVQSFINDTYCTITKAALQERGHDCFIIDHSWEVLNVSLLIFFDINNKSHLKIKMKTTSNLNQKDISNDLSNTDEVMLSTSAKAFALLSHASNAVVQCLTSKKYFFDLATIFLKKQIEKKNSINSSKKSENTDKQINSNNACINDFSESTQASSNMHNYEEVDDDLLDENNWLLSSNIIISRLAAIFQNIIEQDTDHLKESAQLLILFLPFADNSSVFDLLSASCSNNLIKPNFFHHLAKLDIINEILKIICMFKVGNKRIDETTVITDKSISQNIEPLKTDENYSDSDFIILISNILSILSIISRNKYILQNVNSNNQLFSVLSQFASLGTLEISIKNNLWRTISAICTSQTIKNHDIFLKFLFYKAMRIVSDPYTTLNMYHTYVIDFLTKIMKFEPKFFIEDDSIMLKSIIEVISRLIAQFPDSTNFQSSIARFIISSIENHNTNTFAHLFSKSNFKDTIILEKVVKELLPLVIVTAQSKSARSAAAANCVSVMYRVSTLSNSNSIISQFCNSNPLYKNFMNNFMNDYIVKLGSNYGGSMNEETASFKTLNQLANEIRMNQNHVIFV